LVPVTAKVVSLVVQPQRHVANEFACARRRALRSEHRRRAASECRGDVVEAVGLRAGQCREQRARFELAAVDEDVAHTNVSARDFTAEYACEFEQRHHGRPTASHGRSGNSSAVGT
jgi:hypothetical protein